MTSSNEEELKWIDSLWAQADSTLQKEKEEFPSSYRLDVEKELLELRNELVTGFQLLLTELQKLNVEASVEIYDWVMTEGNPLKSLFIVEPDRWAEKPLHFINFVQRSIPAKYAAYLFYAAMNLYTEKDYVNGHLAFRLLTLLFPRKWDFQFWFALCLQKKGLPEFALVPLTIATLLSPQNPYTYFHIGESWMKLKRWEPMNGALKECVNIIGENPHLLPLKLKCEALQKAIPLLSDGKVDNLELSEAPLPISSSLGIQNLQSDKAHVFPLQEVSLEAWEAERRTLEIKFRELAAELSKVERHSILKGTAIGFFERRILRPSTKGIVIPFTSFSTIEVLSAAFFLSTLIVGKKISEASQILSDVPRKATASAALMLSSILDKNDLEIDHGIVKHCYICGSRGDIVVNQLLKNPSYGTEKLPYDEARDDSAVRASRFLPKDIIGKSLLDFGCNEGSVLFACQNLGASSITGFDIYPFPIEKANERVLKEKIPNAKFYVGDMENRAFLASLPKVDTVFLLAILDTSYFVNKTAVLAHVANLAKEVLYYEGHLFTSSHVRPLYDLFVATEFTRFEYFGHFAKRPLIRCSREMLDERSLPPNAVTSDATDGELLNATEIYLFTDSPRNPPFSSKCRLIQFVTR